jgi:hypothetical protein
MPKHTDRYYQDLKKHRPWKHPLWGTMTFHHFQYAHLTRRYSISRVDGVYVPIWFHVPVLHILLGGGKRAGNQLFGCFPNPVQRLAHWVCRLHWGLIPLGIIWAIWNAAKAVF